MLLINTLQYFVIYCKFWFYRKNLNLLRPDYIRFDGCIQYKESIAKNVFQVKEIGVDLAKIAYHYYQTGEGPTGLEEQLNSRINRLAEFLSFENCEFSNMINIEDDEVISLRVYKHCSQF